MKDNLRNDQRCFNSRQVRVAALAACLNFALGGAVAADSPPSDDTLETITVTAQKRSESLQNVPISVQVVSAAELAEENQNTLQSLSEIVPGVHLATFAPGVEIFIRGIGSGSNASFDQSVATFDDDVYHGRSRMSAATFLDLDHLEVLKGPQSTFFGNNAIAGALNLVTKKPDEDKWDGWVRALYGMYGAYAIEGASGGPINDWLAIRVAGTFNGERGWIDNVATGNKIPVDENQAGRLTLLFHPTTDFEATLKIEGGTSSIDGSAFDTPAQVLNCPPPALFGPPILDCANALALKRPVGLNTNEAGAIPGTGQRLDTNEYVLTANYQHWGQTFTSVSAYYDYESYDNLDVSFFGIPDWATGALPESYHQFSQELRVASPVGGTFEYLAGAYIQTDTLHNVQTEQFFLFGPGPTGPSPALEFDDKQWEHSYSAFGSLTWNAAQDLKISAGLRASEVNKNLDYRSFYGGATQTYGGVAPYSGNLCTTTSPSTGLQAILGASVGTPACAFAPSRSDQALTPSARIQYQLTSDAMLYARYDRGFKAGGFNGVDSNGSIGFLPFQPEHVNAYEVGAKTEWFNHTLLLNVDAFYSRYTDLQVSSFHTKPSGAEYTTVNNAGASLTEGFELEAQWVPTEHFRLSVNGTYDDAHYITYPNGPVTILQMFCQANPANAYCLSRFPGGYGSFGNLAGYPLTPRWTSSLAAAYSVDLPRRYRLTTEVSPYATSNYYQNILDYWKGNYVRLDARVTLESPDRAWDVDIIGKNLTDRIIVEEQGMLDQVPIAGYVDWASKEEPRNIAVQFRYRW